MHLLLCLLVDYTTGFGGKYGVQKDRVDQVGICFDSLCGSVMGYKSEFCDGCKFADGICSYVKILMNGVKW